MPTELGYERQTNWGLNLRDLTNKKKACPLLLRCCVPSNLANSQLCSRSFFVSNHHSCCKCPAFDGQRFIFLASIPTFVVQIRNPSFSQYNFSSIFGSQPPALNFLARPRSRATGKSEASGSKGNTERTAVFTSWRCWDG